MREKNGTSNNNACPKCGSLNTIKKDGKEICKSCGNTINK